MLFIVHMALPYCCCTTVLPLFPPSNVHLKPEKHQTLNSRRASNFLALSFQIKSSGLTCKAQVNLSKCDGAATTVCPTSSLCSPSSSSWCLISCTCVSPPNVYPKAFRTLYPWPFCSFLRSWTLCCMDSNWERYAAGFWFWSRPDEKDSSVITIQALCRTLLALFAEGHMIH